MLKPAVDYATSKNLYVIIDFHQIDNATTGTSAADATTFWTDVAPQFANYTNVIYEPFNEPIDTSASWAALKPVVQGWINTIRAAAPNNIIIVPSLIYDQNPGDAAGSPPTGANLMFTAHIYPGNWVVARKYFQNAGGDRRGQSSGIHHRMGVRLNSSDKTWHHERELGDRLRDPLDSNGASWTAWVTDNFWTPSIFSDSALTALTDFGTLVKNWLAAKATSDWVQ